MFVQIFRKSTKRKVISFNDVHRVTIKGTEVYIYPLTDNNQSFDLMLFDFYILE